MKTVTEPTVQELNADAERIRRHDARLRAMKAIVAKFNREARHNSSCVYLRITNGDSVRVCYNFQGDAFIVEEHAYVENLLSSKAQFLIEGYAKATDRELTWNNNRTIFWLSLGVNQKVAK